MCIRDRRRYSAPDLVPRRRHSFNLRLSQELFEEPSSDNDSPRAASDGANPDDNSEDQVPEKVAPWELSAEGKSRIATLKKATVQTSAKMMTRKYLKLFVPTNSVSLVFLSGVRIRRTRKVFLPIAPNKNFVCCCSTSSSCKPAISMDLSLIHI